MSTERNTGDQIKDKAEPGHDNTGHGMEIDSHVPDIKSRSIRRWGLSRIDPGFGPPDHGSTV
jgi:hypothetical protein